MFLDGIDMKFGLIAAGLGSRLVSEGVAAPKPLVKVGGEPLLGRLFRIFLDNGAESISVITNEEMTEVHQFIQAQQLPIPLNVVIKSTPSSFHSFYELKPFLEGCKFCLTTVDPIFREQEFADYISTFASDECDDALMGVTSYIDDEKPLYVKVEEPSMRITGYANQAYEGCKYVSGGIYCMNERALALLPEAMEKGVSRMRGFQQYLVDAGMGVRAFNFSKVIDIDHAEDIQKAEQFIKDTKR